MLICKLLGCQYYKNNECTANLTRDEKGNIICNWDSKLIKKNSKTIKNNK